MKKGRDATAKSVKGLGEVGELSEEIKAELPYWTLVVDHNWSPRQLDEMTMEEIQIIHAIIDMRDDYKTAIEGKGKKKEPKW